MQGPNAPTQLSFHLALIFFKAKIKMETVKLHSSHSLALHYMPVIARGIRNIAKNKTKPCFHEAYIPAKEKRVNKQT